MKTKNKMIAFVEVAIVLCSVFLVAIPAIAAEQNTQKASANEVTTASENDYVLGIYGNANKDDTIDMGDVVYTKLAIFGKKPKTELCDAKYDGRINVLDVIQTKLIILGKEKEITIVDSGDTIVTVNKPIERIVVPSFYALETVRSIKAADRVVGVSEFVKWDKIFFPEFVDHPGVDNADIESILVLEPDLVLSSGKSAQRIRDALEDADVTGIAVLDFYYWKPNIIVDETKKMGYVLNKVEETNELHDFYQGFWNTINEQVEGLSEEDKTTVYLEGWRCAWHTLSEKPGYGNMVGLAGGYNIFGDEPGGSGGGGVMVDAEAVIKRNPEIIIKVIGTRDIGGYGLDVGDTTVLEEIREEIMTRTVLERVTAVENEEVYILTWYVFTGPRNFIGVGYTAKWLYPELFADLNPKAIHQEYLTRFQGLDIDLDEKGVLAYPEPS